MHWIPYFKKLIVPQLVMKLLSFLWTSKAHPRLQNSLPFVPILNGISPVHAVPTNLFKVHLILFSHLFLGLPSGLYPPAFPTKKLYAPLLSLVRATCTTHHFLINIKIQISMFC